MEPADAAREDGLPVEVARFEPRRSLVASVVEHHGRTHTLAAVAVDGGHVRSADAVVLETFVERPYTHRLYTLGDEVANRIANHCARDAGLETEAVGQVGGDVEFAAADVNLAFGCFAEWDHSRVQPMHQGAKRDQIEPAPFRDIQMFCLSGPTR